VKSRVREEIEFVGCGEARHDMGVVRNLRWNVFNTYPIVIREDLGSFDRVLELADIARPAVSFERGNHGWINQPFRAGKVLD
jgi:hypothetical protein